MTPHALMHRTRLSWANAFFVAGVQTRVNGEKSQIFHRIKLHVTEHLCRQLLPQKGNPFLGGKLKNFFLDVYIIHMAYCATVDLSASWHTDLAILVSIFPNYI